jgi:hypothetical protein
MTDNYSRFTQAEKQERDKIMESIHLLLERSEEVCEFIKELVGEERFEEAHDMLHDLNDIAFLIHQGVLMIRLGDQIIEGNNN